MATTAQLGYGRVKRSDGTFTYTSQFDLNDATNTFLGGDVDIGAPPLKTSYLGNYAADGAALAASSFDNRVLTFNVRFFYANTTAFYTAFSLLYKALDPAQFVPPDDATYTYLPFVKWIPQGAPPTRYYQYFRSQPPPLFDGRNLSLYVVARLNSVGHIPVTVTCLPYGRGQSQVL